MWFRFHSNDVRDVVLQQGTNILPYSFGVDVGCILKPAKGLVLQPILWNSYLNHEFVWNGDSYGTSDAGATRRYGVDISTRYQILPFLYLDNDINWAVPRVVGAPRGDNYVELAPTLTSTGGLGFQFQNGFYANLRYRYMHDRPAVQDASIIAQGYFVNDLISGYQAKKWGINLQIQNLFNAKWNEAMFAQETRLKGESASVEELTFTPGTPFMVKIGLTYKI
nr:TonB-dependent receptor [Flavobacterium johnsoniae]